MKRHNSLEDLQRRTQKLAASNARYKTRVKKLRGLLDERTDRLQALWGHLTDVQREVGRVWPTGEPGDWETLLHGVKALVQDYVDLGLLVRKMDIRNALLKEEIAKLDPTSVSWLVRMRRFLDWFKRRS